MINFNIHLHGELKGMAGEITQALARIENKLGALTQTNTQMANTIDDIFAIAKKQTDAATAMISIVTELRDTIKNKTTLSPKDQATVDAIFKSLQENADALIAAANVNTPDETPADVAAVEEFEALPRELLVP
jgi:methyl-accepting chemotaxis protein